jgi:serine/threonine-protein kinase RsbW
MARFARQISVQDARTLELALAEVLNNIVEHAYGDQGKGRVSLTLWHQDVTLSCTVIDEGRAMPGLTLPEGRMQDVAEQVEDLAEGGWGWAMILALTEDIHYERQGGKNRLSFNVPLTSTF